MPLSCLFGKRRSRLLDDGKELVIQGKDAFEKKYRLGTKIGQGNFSEVFKGVQKDKAGSRVAVKVMKKERLSEKDINDVKTEAGILYKLNHPSIIHLYGVYEDANTFYIVTEYLEGGELFDRIVEKEVYSEIDAAGVMKTLASALKYSHENGVVHRDIKPENVLLRSKNDDSAIKLADFGFAKEVNPEGSAGLKTCCGTPGYVAPEVISGVEYSTAVDMWSVGVILYILLCGYPPFYHTNTHMLFELIRAGDFNFDDESWERVSGAAKDLIRKLLVVDPTKRYTAAQVLEHPWVKSGGADKDLTPVLSQLQKYQLRRKFKRAQNGALFVTMVQNQVKKSKRDVMSENPESESSDDDDFGERQEEEKAQEEGEEEKRTSKEQSQRKSLKRVSKRKSKRKSQPSEATKRASLPMVVRLPSSPL